MDKIKISNGEVTIDYTDSQTGDITLVFIHGWCIDQTYWANQVSYFTKKYRVITIDLPGFGNSGKGRKNQTANDYSQDILTVISKLELKNVILIGHSMSGAIIVETAKTNTDAIMGIVGVDNLKNIGVSITPETEKEWSKFYNNARVNFIKVMSEGIQDLFAPSTDNAIRQRVTKDILSSDPTIVIDCLENLDKYPFLETLKSLNKTIYLINSDYSTTDTLKFQENNISYCLLNIGTTGHYPMLEKASEFNSFLEQVIEKITQSQAINPIANPENK